MKKTKYLKKFIKYHWNESPIEEEPHTWSNHVISIRLATENRVSSASKFCKIISLFQKIRKTLGFSKKLNASTRLLLYESLLKMEREGKEIFKGICYCPESFQPTFLITDPNIITSILMHERNEEGPHAMFSGGVPTQIAKKILGNNILTCPEMEHKNLQQFSAPHFTNHMMHPYFANFQKSSIELIQKWESKGNGAVIDVSTDLPIFAARSVAENILGFKGSIEELCEAMFTLLKVNNKRFKLPRDQRSYARALDFINKSAEKTLRGEDYNFLKCMKEAKDKNGNQKFKMDEIISMAKILFFAGQDSTSSLLAFLLYTLGKLEHVHWQDKLFQEYSISGKHLLNFIFESQSLENLFKEALRIHPSAFTQTRETVQDILINESYFIPKGSLLYLLHYFSQRDSRRWGKDASEFDPRRFENPDLTPKFHGPLQYFSLGPTICLGRHFVMLFMKTFLMQCILTHKWEACLPVPHLEAEIMLELKPCVNIKLTKRG